MTSMTVASPGTGTRVSSWSYWPSGDTREQIDPNGVAHDDYFDAAGQIATNVRAKGASTITQPYTYDVDGNRTTDEKGTEVYNSRDQLIKWTRGAREPSTGSRVDYTVLGSGAVKHATDSAGPDTDYVLDGDRLSTTTTAARVTSYAYDGFGDLKSIDAGTPTDVSDDTTYAYDSFQRLNDSKTPGQPETTYAYDGLDRLDNQGLPGQSTPTTVYGYIGSTGDLSQETGAATKTYDYDANGNRQGQQASTSPGSYSTYVTDPQGTVQGFEDPSTGGIQAGTEYRYDPYGTPQTPPLTLNPAGQGNPFRFQGFYYDPAAGSYNARAREYRPDLQRFLTQDRYEADGSDLGLAANPLTSDRYAYVAGNLTNRIDYDGNGDIINGGLNPTPRPFNHPQTGLSRQQPPRNR